MSGGNGALLLEVAHREEGVLTEPAPDVLFEAFRDSALQFRLRYWTEAFTDSPAVLQGRLNRAILLRFRESGITIPYPQRVLEHSGLVFVGLGVQLAVKAD